MTIVSYVKRHSFIASVLILAVIVIAVIIGRNSGAKPVEALSNSSKKVALVDVTDFRLGQDIIAVNGTIEAHGQADLKSQISAPIAVIHGDIGDAVYAGQVIIELENNDTKAQLEQTKAALSLAQGQYFTGGVSLDSAKSSAVDTIRSAYIKGYDAVNTQIDPLINNADGKGGRLISFVSDSALSDRIITKRVDLTGILRIWKNGVDEVSASSDVKDLIDALNLSSRNLNIVDNYLGDVSQALNDASKSSDPSFSTFLNNWKTIASAARSGVSGAAAAVTGASSGLGGASASYGTTAEAQVSVAKAGVANLEAQLEKTIIRSPISGKISAIPLRTGELASPGVTLASVVGGDGLQVRAYASGEDLSRLKVGSVAKVQGDIDAIVESVAPSVSASSKKVEVVVAIRNPAISGLVIGQNVQATIKASIVPIAVTDSASSATTKYILPIQNVKIIPGAAYVFTVGADSKIERHDVILGEVSGDFIEVLSGLSDGMKIVSPVYELDEGQSVSTEE